MKYTITNPGISLREEEYVHGAIRGAWNRNSYEYIREYARKISEYLQVEYVIPLPSCTSAIHLALMALNISQGDQVIVPDVTWIASAAPVEYTGADTIFSDIDNETWCISIDSIRNIINKDTKAIIAVDLYGNMPDMKKIRDVAGSNGIYLIEDAAQAIGTTQNGKYAGTFGDVGVFSFHGSKTATTGEGGALVTHDRKIFDRCITLMNHGRSDDKSVYCCYEIAHKYAMSDLQAALGLAQLEHIDELVQKKREIFKWYTQSCSGIDSLSFNPTNNNTNDSYWMITALLKPYLGLDKHYIAQEMHKRGISTRPMFDPLSSMPAYRNHRDTMRARSENKNAYTISPYAFNLPSGMDLNKSDVEYISDELIRIINNGNKKSSA